MDDLLKTYEREMGQIQADITGLRRDLDSIKSSQNSMKTKQDEIHEALLNNTGKWKTVTIFGSIFLIAFGAFITGIVKKLGASIGL